MTRKTYEVRIVSIYEVTLDDSLLPDNEWRSVFYPFYDLADVASHILHNVLRFKQEPDEVEGFCGVAEAANVAIEQVVEQEYDATEVILDAGF